MRVQTHIVWKIQALSSRLNMHAATYHKNMPKHLSPKYFHKIREKIHPFFTQSVSHPFARHYSDH